MSLNSNKFKGQLRGKEFANFFPHFCGKENHTTSYEY